MNCPNCGAALNPGATFCPNCGASVSAGAPPPSSSPPSPQPPPAYAPTGGGAAAGALPTGERIPSRLVPAVLVTIFCCLAFGIPALVNAARVAPLVEAGRLDQARHCSSRALLWIWLAIGLGLLGVAAYGAAVMMGVMSEMVRR